MRPESGDWLYVEGIELLCTIGITARERATKQRIVINLQLNVDFDDVGRSDAIQDTVDYRVVSRHITEITEKSSFQLIETLAGHICRSILAAFPRIRRVRVGVWKPGALSGARSVGAVIVSGRSNDPDAGRASSGRTS